MIKNSPGRNILEWVSIPFSWGSSQPSDQTRSPALQADALISEPPGKPNESRQTGSGQTGDGKSESRYFRNQQTWTGMSDFNLDDHYIYYCGQESLRRNGVAIIVNDGISLGHKKEHI